jgi:tetratricopeptide (TPR) repeat protein
MSTAIASGGGARRPLRIGRVLVVAAALAATTVPVARFLTAGRDAGGQSAPPRIESDQERLTSLQQRVASSPDDAGAWLSLAELATQQAVRTGDPASYGVAQRAVGEARRLTGDDPRALGVDGVLALSLHDFARAYDVGVDAHRSNPASSDALGVLVDASVELGRYDEAARHVQEMLDLRPGSAALARASYLRELNGDLPGAVAAMEQAASAATGNPVDTASFTELLGQLFLAQGELDRADAAFAGALTLSPQRVGATLGAARVAVARGDLPAAIALVADATSRTSLPAAATLLGQLHLQAGDAGAADDAFALVRANEQLLAAAGLDTDLESALFEADHGDPARAVELAEAAYATRHTVFTADALGWALTRAGRPVEAVPFVEESLRLGTASAALHVHAAAAFSAAGQPMEAAAQLRSAFELSPWPALQLRTTAGDLAGALGLAVPEPWARPAVGPVSGRS